jgi:hypothetical protein
MTVMRAYLGSLLVVLSLIACGGTSDTSSQTGGGSSAGGNGSAGHDNGAGASAGNNSAGSNSAGSSSAGSSSAGVGGRIDGTSGSGLGGADVGGTGSGGARTVDARCPAKRPMGACSADDAGLACQYDNFSGCLCYPNMIGTLTSCQQVDPTCSSTTAPTPAAGAGGAAGKVAPPPLQVCSCSASTWSCHF